MPQPADISPSRPVLLRRGLLSVLAVILVALVVLTIDSLYGGTGRDESLDSEERVVTATVTGPCHQDGPIGRNGLGYWWTCRVTVGEATIELADSVATPKDVGHTVQIHELCTKQHHTGCRYGRLDPLGLAGAVEAIHLIGGTAVFVFLVLAVVRLYRFVRPSPVAHSLY